MTNVLSGAELAAFEANSTGLEIVAAAKEGRIPLPYMDTLCMRFAEVGEKSVGMYMPVAAAFKNERGLTHSGAIVSLADAAGGLAARATLPVGKSYLVSSFFAAFHAEPCRNITDLTAIANVVQGYSEGSNTITTSVDIHDNMSDGTPLATAILTNAVLTRPPASREGTPAVKPDIEPVMSSPDFAPVAGNPFLATIGAQGHKSDPSQLQILPNSGLHNSIGTMHGGAILSTLIGAANQFVGTTLRDGQTTRLSSIHAFYLRAVHDSSKPVIARASSIKPGSIVSTVRAELGDAHKPSATADIGYTVS